MPLTLIYTFVDQTVQLGAQARLQGHADCPEEVEAHHNESLKLFQQRRAVHSPVLAHVLLSGELDNLFRLHVPILIRGDAEANR